MSPKKSLTTETQRHRGKHRELRGVEWIEQNLFEKYLIAVVRTFSVSLW